MKVIAGGQTGVDRGALDAALDHKLRIGGWCPKGKKAEDGAIPDRYPLRETPSSSYEQRTEWNVRDSDGTLIITTGAMEGGTAYTARMATRWRRPCMIFDLEVSGNPAAILEWIHIHEIRILNIAGPRASKQPDIHQRARDLLGRLFAMLHRNAADAAES